MNDTVSLLITLLTALNSVGLIGNGVWMYRKENKRIKQAEADKAEADLNTLAAREWKEIADNRERKLQDAYLQIKEKDSQITGLYDVVGAWRDQCDEKDKRIHELELKIMSYEIRLCNRRGCAEREPQTGY